MRTVDALPRAYLVHRTLPAADAEEALARVLARGYEPSLAAVVEGGHALDAPPSPRDQVDLATYSDAQVVIRTSSPQDGFLVLSDANYPGWRATVDGEQTPVHAANYLLRGVYVPAGDHTVVFRYAPDSWRNGILLSALGLATGAALLGWAWSRSVRLRQ